MADDDDCYYDCYELSRRDVASAIVPKIAAALSILGSSCIIAEVLVDHGQKKGRAVPRLLLSMSISDLFFSFAWFLTTWPSPVGTNYVWGAKGTTATCTAQGFFIQLGWIATPLFNISLSLFYLLMIRYNWSERKLNRLEPWVHGTIWALALGTAIMGIPLTLYNNSWEICWIDSYPQECRDSFRHGTTDCTRGDNAWIYGLAFTIFPVWMCIILSIVFMALIFMSVRKTEKRSMQYSSRPPSNSRRRRVACQALWYIGVFLVTFVPDTVSALLYFINDYWFFWLDIFAYFFLPLQGFLNFIVFLRPRKDMHTRLGKALRCLLCFCEGSTNGPLCCIFRSSNRSDNETALGSATENSKQSGNRIDSIDLPSGANRLDDQSPRSYFVHFSFKDEETDPDPEAVEGMKNSIYPA